MSAQRVLGISLFACAVAACAPRGTTTTPRPLKPEEGPNASIRVGYSGGLVNRSLSAYFRTEENAYVLVGHLSGDGVIRVLYPSTPAQAGYIRGKKTNQTQTVAAHYDGAPSLYTYTMSPYRSLSAMYDSYDGRGHGYVFIIASRRPIASSLVSDMGEWDEMNVTEYSYSHDPRAAIRDFADMVSAGAKYTLKFASSFATSHYDSYASRAWDCALLSSFGFFSLSPWWNSPGWNSSSWNSMLWGLRSSPSNYCGRQGYRTYRTYASNTTFVPTIIPSPPQTPGTPAPTLSRPGRRPLGEPGPASGPITRSTLTRGVATGVGVSARPQFGERRTPRPPTPTTESVRTASPPSRTGYASRPSYDRSPSRPAETASERRGSASSGSSATTTRSTTHEQPTSSTSTERSAPTRTESPRTTSPRDARSPDKPND